MTTLREAAQAVLDRWDSPKWEWHQGPTAALMTTLRAALEAPKPEPCGWVYINRLTGQRTFSRHLDGFVDYTTTVEVPVYAEPVANQTKTSGSPIQSEPVAWMTPGQDLHLNNPEGFRFSDWTPLYDHPPRREWRGLTDGEIYTAYITATNQTLRPQDERLAFAFARAIEAALKEKNACPAN
jgi:hypothetical protein